MSTLQGIMQRLETAINLNDCFIGDILLFSFTTLAAHSIRLSSRKGYNIISRNSEYSWTVVFWDGSQ